MSWSSDTWRRHWEAYLEGPADGREDAVRKHWKEHQAQLRVLWSNLGDLAEALNMTPDDFDLVARRLNPDHVSHEALRKCPRTIGPDDRAAIDERQVAAALERLLAAEDRVPCGAGLSEDRKREYLPYPLPACINTLVSASVRFFSALGDPAERDLASTYERMARLMDRW